MAVLVEKGGTAAVWVALIMQTKYILGWIGGITLLKFLLSGIAKIIKVVNEAEESNE